MSCYIACQGSLSTTDAAMDQTTKFTTTTNGDASGMPVTTELGETAIICDIQGASTLSVKTSKDESTKVTTNGEDASSMSVNTQIGESTNSDIQDGSIDIIG